MKVKPVTTKGPLTPAARAGRRLRPPPGQRCRPRAGAATRRGSARRSAPAAPPGAGEKPLPGEHAAAFLARIFLVSQPLKACTVLKCATGLGAEGVRRLGRT